MAKDGDCASEGGEVWGGRACKGSSVRYCTVVWGAKAWRGGAVCFKVVGRG